VTLLLFTGTTIAQQQQQYPIIKPTFTYGQLDLALRLMEKIELNGSEVDAFLEIKSIFYPVLVKGANEKKQLNDKITLDMNAKQAENVLAFLNRARLTGSEVQTFKEFKDAIFTAAAVLRK
jgi:hypothetical protein